MSCFRVVLSEVLGYICWVFVSKSDLIKKTRLSELGPGNKKENSSNNI